MGLFKIPLNNNFSDVYFLDDSVIISARVNALAKTQHHNKWMEETCLITLTTLVITLRKKKLYVDDEKIKK